MMMSRTSNRLTADQKDPSPYLNLLGLAVKPEARDYMRLYFNTIIIRILSSNILHCDS